MTQREDLLLDIDKLQGFWLKHEDDASAFYALKSVLDRLVVVEQTEVVSKNNVLEPSAESTSVKPDNQSNQNNLKSSSNDIQNKNINSESDNNFANTEDNKVNQLLKNSVETAAKPIVKIKTLEVPDGNDTQATLESALSSLRPLIF